MKETFNSVAFSLKDVPVRKSWKDWIFGIEQPEETKDADESHQMQEQPFQYVHKGLVRFLPVLGRVFEDQALIDGWKFVSVSDCRPFGKLLYTATLQRNQGCGDE